MTEELLTAAEAAAFLKLPSVRAFYSWRRRHPIPNRVAGRAFRCFKRDLLLARPPSETVDIRDLAREHARGGSHVH